MKFHSRQSVFLLVLILSVVYFPAFNKDFGMHNDYRLLPGSFKDHEIFGEALHLYAAGRPLQFFLINLQSWCIEKVSQLALSRFVSFLFMLGFAGLFYHFLRRHLRLDGFWSKTIVLSMVMLPVAQLDIIWATNLLSGYVTLFLALLSYVVLDSAFLTWEGSLGQRLRTIAPWAAVGLFLAALFTYPINAVFVFVCTFAHVLFSGNERRAILKIALRDVAFYGFCMLIYYLANVLFFIPYAPEHGAGRLTGTAYAFTATFDFSQKFKMLAETFTVALSGVWHLVIGNAGAALNAVLIILAVVLIFNCRKIRHAIYFLSITVGLFVLSNVPTLMAKGCFTLMGYRVIFPATAIVMIGLLGLWQKTAARFPKREALIKRGAAAFVCFSVLIAFINVSDATRNFNRELNHIRQKVESANLENISRILLVFVPTYSGETLIERKLPYEFSYMLTFPDMAEPIIAEALKKKGVTVIPQVISSEANVILYDDYTYVIDVNEAAPRQVLKPRALVTTSSSARRHVEIYQEMGGIYLGFEEMEAGLKIPFWPASIRPPNPSWLQVEFQKEVSPVLGFGFGLYTIGREETALPVEVLLQGSVDGLKWVNLGTQLALRNPADEHLRIYKVINPGSYKKYRFYPVSVSLTSPLPVSKIYMFLHI